MRRSIIALALATAVPAAVAAQSMPPGFYAYGYTTLEHYESDGFDSNFGYADLSLGFRPYGNAGSGVSGSGSGSMPGFGFQVDFIGLWDLDDDYDENSIMPWAYYDSSFGRWSVGYTPILITDYVDRQVLMPGSVLNLFELGVLNSSILELERYREGDNLLSLRYDHQIGGLGFGASYTDIEDSGGLEAIALGVSYQTGDLKIGLGYETFPDEDYHYLGASLRYEMDAYVFTANATQHEGIFGGKLTSVGLGVEYSFNDKLMLGAGATHASISGGGDDLDVYSIYGEYDVWNGIVLGLGYGSFDNDDIYMASIGYRFDFGR